jgi:transposase
MDVLYRRCAGLDVHKKTVQVCVRCMDDRGQVQTETRQFGTMTRDILALGDWLGQWQVTDVAMESTGVFWKPVWNLLEGCFELVLCNAREVKQVPGRKTDVKDCQWLAQLMQYGLLKSSFVPSRPMRELRDLTRQRVQMVKEHTATANRLQKVLEDANIKLASVASDILGVSGRDMLQALIVGESAPQAMAQLARRRLREKIPELAAALEGNVDDHHRFLLRIYFNHLLHLEAMIAQFDARIDEMIEAPALNAEDEAEGILPFPQAVQLLTTIPGVSECAAESIVAEIGTDMSRFPGPDHLASWAGICPGNNVSAGKRHSGKTTAGNRWLRRVLTQAAWAAAATKDTYLSAQFRRVAPRRGKKRAIIALAHSMLVSIYYMLTRHESYADLGADYLDHLHPQRLARSLTRRLEKLGYTVTLEPAQAAR